MITDGLLASDLFFIWALIQGLVRRLLMFLNPLQQVILKEHPLVTDLVRR